MFPHELLSHGSTLHVVAFRITETGTYNPQFGRPYMMDASKAQMDNVVDAANQAMEKGFQITPTVIAMANQGKPLVTPTTAPDAMVNIPNGWQERRFRFILTIDVKQNIGTVCRYYYTGYSSHRDYSHNHSLDPNMVFFVNSVIRSSMSRAMTPTQGEVTMERNLSSRHVIAEQNWEGAFSPNQKYMMRPEDVYVQMSSAELMGNTDRVLDTRPMAQQNAAMSNLTNGLTHNYASTIINAYARSSRVTPTYGNDNESLTDAALQLRVTNTSEENPLLSAVSQLRGAGITQNNFTIAELMKLDQNTWNQIDFAPLTPADMGIIHQVGQSSPWSGQDGQTMAAVKISQAMGALMAVTQLQNVRVISTNHTPEGQPTTTVVGMGFNQAQLPQRNQTLADRFNAEIVADISFNNMLGYYVEVNADAMGETRIKISIDNRSVEEFVSPTFADNLLAPIVTTNQNSFVRIASDFNSLLSDLSPAGTQQYGQSLDTSYL